MKTKILLISLLLICLTVKAQFGAVLGSFNGVTSYSNGSFGYVSNQYNYIGSTNTGMKWQCVEYVQRYYFVIYGIDINPYFGNANTFYNASNAAAAGLQIFPNGGSDSPHVGDIICSDGGSYGHVGIIREVGSTYINVIQQNWSNTTLDNSLTLSRTGNYIANFGTGYPVQGWLRDPLTNPSCTFNVSVNGGAQISLTQGFKFWQMTDPNYYHIYGTISNLPNGSYYSVWLANQNGNPLSQILNNQSSTSFNYQFQVSSPYNNGSTYSFIFCGQGQQNNPWTISSWFYMSQLPTLSISINPTQLCIGQQATVNWTVNGGIPSLPDGGWINNIQLQWYQNNVALTILAMIPVSNHSYSFTVPSSISGGTIPGSNFQISGSNPTNTSIPPGYVFSYTSYFNISSTPGAATVNGPSSGCAGIQLTFSATASNATTFNWSAPSDWTPNSGIGSSFTSTPGSSGNVTATPTNSCGNGTPGSKNVTINPIPGTATITGPSSGCAGTSLTFSANASNATSYNWAAPTDWTPNTGTGSSFSSTPGSTGNVTATPTNSCGNGTPGSKNVTINPVPGTATITGPSSGCAGTSLTFTANASNATSYNWAAPTDWTPNTGTGSSFSSTPGSTGNVTATPTNSCGNGIPGSKNVTINPVPGTATVTGPSSGCAGTSLTFTASASNATSYNWTAPTDWTPNTGTGSSFSSTPGSTGNVTATPTNSCGNGTPGSKNVTINPVPGTATITGPSSGCAGTTLTFTVNASNATSYNWTAPTDWTPNTGTGSSFSSTPGSTGNVIATPTNSCGNGTPGSKNVTINPLPGTATITGPSSGCAGTTLTFTVNASNATSYNWTAPTDWTPNTGTGSSFSSTPGSTGNVIATPINSCGNGTPGSKNVTINPLPGTATITGPSSGCAGTSLTFTANASNATSYNWTTPIDWTPNTGVGSTFTSTPGSSGNVTATPTNSCGNGPSGNQSMTITALPGAATVTGSDEGCSTPLTFYASASNAISFNWTAPSNWVPNIGSGTSFTTTPMSSGNVCATPYNSCGDGTQGCKYFTLKAGSGTAPNQPGSITGPLNPLSGSLQNYSISSVLNADSYLWTVPTSWVINSGQGTTGINVTVGVNSGNVCVSAVNFCGTSPQECSLISVIVGITEISFIKNLSVYPNPNSGDFILQLEILKPTDIEIELLTVLGQGVYMDKRNYQNGFYKIPIIFTQYPNGCYILKVKVDKETEVIRIIKE